MEIDVRTMYLTMAATCFLISAAFYVGQVGRFRRDGTAYWTLGWFIHGMFFALIALRGIVWDSVSVVAGNTCLTVSYSLIYVALAQFRNRPIHPVVWSLPSFSTLLFFLYFFHVGNLMARVLYISGLSALQTAMIAVSLFQDVPSPERRAYRMTGLAFLLASLVWLQRFVEPFTLPLGQLSVLNATGFRSTALLVSFSVSILSSIGFVLMIRGRAEDALRRSEARRRAVFRSLAEGIVFLNTKGEVEEINETVHIIHGHTFSDLTDPERDPRHRIIRPDGSPFPVNEQPAIVALHTGKAVHDVEMGVPDSEGNLRWRMVSAQPVWDDEGNLLGAVASFFDITGRKRAEEALLLSEHRERERAGELEALLDAIPTSVFISRDPDCLRMTGNRAAEEIVNRPHGSELSLTASPEARPQNFKAMKDGRELRMDELPAQRAARGFPVRDFDFDLIFEDGWTRHVTGYGTPLWDEQGQPRGSVGVLIDITERKRMEEALRESERRLSGVIEQIPVGVGLIDADGRFVLMNSAMQRYVPGTIPSRDPARTIRWKGVDVSGNAIPPSQFPGARALRGESVIPGVEFLYTADDGQETWTVVSAVPFASGEQEHNGRAIVVAQDITELKRAEDSLRSTVERFYAILSSSYAAILLVTDDNFVEFGNQAFCDLFGLGDSPENLKGLTAREMIDKIRNIYRDPEKNMIRIGQIVAENRPVKGEEIEMMGDRVCIRDFVPLTIEGRSHGRAWHHRDITDSKQIEEELRASRDELERRVEERTNELSEAYDKLKKETQERDQVEQRLRQSQKLEALGTLAGGIAHDFNNVLAAIIGFSEIAKGRTTGDPKAHKAVQRIFEAGIRGRELVKQMLTFSRKTEQEMRPLLLSSVVKETIKLLRASIPTTISIEVDVRSESSFIQGDLVQVQQVLMNLCTNGAFAMRERGGVLTVELRDFRVNGESKILGLKSGLYMRLAVSDTGVGIAPEHMEKIFDPFFTTKKLGEGTGLGLSVVHGIVSQHGGLIKAESELGKGSTFTVYFPEGKEVVSFETTLDESVATGDEHVLFVDDEEALIEMGEELLADLGYHVTSRLSSREALALFRLDPSRFDLILTDQTMPDMTGVEFAREVMSIRRDIPVILCTGFSHLVDANKARETGIRAFVMKPLTRKEIARTVRKVLDERERQK
jgi:PAS domain S-box-containing protein